MNRTRKQIYKVFLKLIKSEESTLLKLCKDLKEFLQRLKTFTHLEVIEPESFLL